MHNPQMFANSKLFQLGEKGLLFPNDVKMINNVPIAIMILGDPAYP